MTHAPQDPMAGTTARRIREHPNEPQPVVDPTDPRNGQMPGRPTEHRLIVDPTDPRNGQMPGRPTEHRLIVDPTDPRNGQDV